MDILVDPAFTVTIAGAYALLFSLSGIHKLRAPQLFRATLDAYAVLPAQANLLATWAVPLLELTIAAGLMHPQGRSFAAVGAAILLALYTALMTLTMWRGRTISDCGCSLGHEAHPLQWALVWRNLLLAVVALVPAAPSALPLRELSTYDMLTALLAVSMASLLYALSNTLIANHLRQRDFHHD